MNLPEGKEMKPYDDPKDERTEPEKWQIEAKITELRELQKSLAAAPTPPATRIHEGWKLVPVELTAENGMKAALMGEFRLRVLESGEDGNERMREVTVPWDTIKQIHRAVVAAAPTPPLPVLQLETQLSDRDVKALADYLAQISMPPAQENMWQKAVLNACMVIEAGYKESDPSGTLRGLIDWHVANERDNAQAPDDRLRKAAEGAAAEWRKGFLSGEGLALKVIDALEK